MTPVKHNYRRIWRSATIDICFQAYLTHLVLGRYLKINSMNSAEKNPTWDIEIKLKAVVAQVYGKITDGTVYKGIKRAVPKELYSLSTNVF